MDDCKNCEELKKEVAKLHVMVDELADIIEDELDAGDTVRAPLGHFSQDSYYGRPNLRQRLEAIADDRVDD